MSFQRETKRIDVSSMLPSNMSSNAQMRTKDEFQVNQCVWARRFDDGIYWPGRITSISCQRSSTTNYLSHQLCSYLIVYFQSNQNNWATDVLPYREYRDYISKHLMFFYQSNFEWRNQLIRAMNQADQHFQILPSDPLCLNEQDASHRQQESYTWNYSYQNPSTSWCSSCPCCPSTYYSGVNETYGSANTNSKDFKSITAVIIVTNRNYSSPSFLSFLHHSLTPFTHRSIHYIDPTNININAHPPLPPTVSNIIYLICFDHHSTIIEQILDTNILHNLQAHLNYYFLLVNSPSQSLINHVYDNVMDKRSIVIVQYHSSLDESSLLVCSGDRPTFDNLAETFLKYLSSKIKYLDESISSSTSDESSTSDSNQITMRTKKTNKMKSIPSKLLVHPPTECNVKNILEQTELNK